MLKTHCITEFPQQALGGSDEFCSNFTEGETEARFGSIVGHKGLIQSLFPLLSGSLGISSWAAFVP
jgi:hypothetical protein